MTSNTVTPIRVDETLESTRLGDPPTSQAPGGPDRGPPATGAPAWSGARLAAPIGIGLAALGLLLTRRRAAVARADSDDERE
jgi:hypothetical protein